MQCLGILFKVLIKFIKIGVRENVAIFIGKQLCWSLYLMRPSILLKRESNVVSSCEHCHFFKNSFFTELLWWLLLSRGVPWEICKPQACFLYSVNLPFMNVLSFFYETVIFGKDSFLFFTNISLKCLNLSPCITNRAMCESITDLFLF